jgi:hypothetical protein
MQRRNGRLSRQPQGSEVEPDDHPLAAQVGMAIARPGPVRLDRRNVAGDQVQALAGPEGEHAVQAQEAAGGAGALGGEHDQVQRADQGHVHGGGHPALHEDVR